MELAGSGRHSVSELIAGTATMSTHFPSKVPLGRTPSTPIVVPSPKEGPKVGGGGFVLPSSPSRVGKGGQRAANQTVPSRQPTAEEALQARMNSVGRFNALAGDIQGNERPEELVNLLEYAALSYVSAGDNAPIDEASKLGKKLEGWIKQPTFFAGAGPNADKLFARLGKALEEMKIAGGAYEAAKQTRQAARDAQRSPIGSASSGTQQTLQASVGDGNGGQSSAENFHKAVDAIVTSSSSRKTNTDFLNELADAASSFKLATLDKTPKGTIEPDWNKLRDSMERTCRDRIQTLSPEELKHFKLAAATLKLHSFVAMALAVELESAGSSEISQLSHDELVNLGNAAAKLGFHRLAALARSAAVKPFLQQLSNEEFISSVELAANSFEMLEAGQIPMTPEVQAAKDQLLEKISAWFKGKKYQYMKEEQESSLPILSKALKILGFTRGVEILNTHLSQKYSKLTPYGEESAKKRARVLKRIERTKAAAAGSEPSNGSTPRSSSSDATPPSRSAQSSSRSQSNDNFARSSGFESLNNSEPQSKVEAAPAGQLDALVGLANRDAKPEDIQAAYIAALASAKSSLEQSGEPTDELAQHSFVMNELDAMIQSGAIRSVDAQRVLAKLGIANLTKIENSNAPKNLKLIAGDCLDRHYGIAFEAAVDAAVAVAVAVAGAKGTKRFLDDVIMASLLFNDYPKSASGNDAEIPAVLLDKLKDLAPVLDDMLANKQALREADDDQLTHLWRAFDTMHLSDGKKAVEDERDRRSPGPGVQPPPRAPGAAQPVAVEIFKPTVIDLALPRAAPAAREAARAETRNMLLALGEPYLSVGARVTAVERVRQAWAPVASEITFVDNSDAKRRQYVSDAYLRDLESLISDELDAWTPEARGNLESAIRFLSTDPQAAKEVPGHLDLILKVLELKKDGADALAKAAIPGEVGNFVRALTGEAFDLGQVGISALNLTRGLTPVDLTQHLRDAFKDETREELQARLERLDAAKQSTQALNLYKNAIELVRRELVENIGAHEIREQRAQSVAAYLGHTKDAIAALHGVGGSPDLVGALNALKSAREHADKIIELDPPSAMSGADRRRDLMRRVIAGMNPDAQRELASVMHGPQLRELIDMAFAAREASLRQGQPVPQGLDDVLADLMMMQQVTPAEGVQPARGGNEEERAEATRQTNAALHEVFGFADAFGIAIAANLDSIVNRPGLRDGDWESTFMRDTIVGKYFIADSAVPGAAPGSLKVMQMVDSHKWEETRNAERSIRIETGLAQMHKQTDANEKQRAMLPRVANVETLKLIAEEAMDPAHSPINLNGRAGRLLGGEARNTFSILGKDASGNVRVHCVRHVSPTHFQADDISEPIPVAEDSFARFEMEITITPDGAVRFSEGQAVRIEFSVQPKPTVMDVLLSGAATPDDLTRSMKALGQLQSSFSKENNKMLWENHKDSHEVRQQLTVMPTHRLQALQRKLGQVDGFARQQRLASNDWNWQGRSALQSMERAIREILAVRRQVGLALIGPKEAVDLLRLKLSTTKHTQDDLRLMLAHLTGAQLAELGANLEANPPAQKSWPMRVFSRGVKKDELLEAVRAAQAAPRSATPGFPNEELVLPTTRREVRQDALINALANLLDNETRREQEAKKNREVFIPLPLQARLGKLSTQDLEQIASRSDQYALDAPQRQKLNMAAVMQAVQVVLDVRKAALKKGLATLSTPELEQIAEGKSVVKLELPRKLMPSANLTMSVVREILNQRAAADERSPLEIVNERLDGQISALELAQHQVGLPSEDRIRALKQAAATLVTRAALKQPGELPPEPEPAFEKRFEQILASLAPHLSEEQLIDLAPDFANSGVDFSASIESGLNARILKLRSDFVATFKGVVSAMNESQYSIALIGLRKMRAKGNEILELDQRLHPGVQRQRDSITADLTAGAVQALSNEQKSALAALMDSDDARIMLAAIVEASTRLTGGDGSLVKELGGIAALWSNIRFSAGDLPVAQQPLDPAKALEDEDVQATLLDVWNIEVGANQTLVKKPSTWLQDFRIESLTVLAINDPEAPSELQRDFTSYTESVYSPEGMHYLNALRAFNALDPSTQATAAIEIGERFFRSTDDVDHLNFGGPDTGRVREVLDSNESGEKKLAKLVPLFQEFRTKAIELVRDNAQLLAGFKAAAAAGRYGPPPAARAERKQPDLHVDVKAERERSSSDRSISSSEAVRQLGEEFEFMGVSDSGNQSADRPSALMPDTPVNAPPRVATPDPLRSMEIHLHKLDRAVKFRAPPALLPPDSFDLDDWDDSASIGPSEFVNNVIAASDFFDLQNGREGVADGKLRYARLLEDWAHPGIQSAGVNYESVVTTEFSKTPEFIRALRDLGVTEAVVRKFLPPAPMIPAGPQNLPPHMSPIPGLQSPSSPLSPPILPPTPTPGKKVSAFGIPSFMRGRAGTETPRRESGLDASRASSKSSAGSRPSSESTVLSPGSSKSKASIVDMTGQMLSAFAKPIDPVRETYELDDRVRAGAGLLFQLRISKPWKEAKLGDAEESAFLQQCCEAAVATMSADELKAVCYVIERRGLTNLSSDYVTILDVAKAQLLSQESHHFSIRLPGLLGAGQGVMDSVRNSLRAHGRSLTSANERQLLLETIQKLLISDVIDEDYATRLFATLSIAEVSMLIGNQQEEGTSYDIAKEIAATHLNERASASVGRFNAAIQELRSIDVTKQPRQLVPAAIRAMADLEILDSLSNVDGGEGLQLAQETQKKRREDFLSTLKGKALDEEGRFLFPHPVLLTQREGSALEAVFAQASGGAANVVLGVASQQVQTSATLYFNHLATTTGRRPSEISPHVTGLGIQFAKQMADDLITKDGIVQHRFIDEAGEERSMTGASVGSGAIRSAASNVLGLASGVPMLATIFSRIANKNALEVVRPHMADFFKLNGITGTPRGVERLVITARMGEDGALIARYDYTVDPLHGFEGVNGDDVLAKDGAYLHVTWEATIDKRFKVSTGPFTHDSRIDSVSPNGT